MKDKIQKEIIESLSLYHGLLNLAPRIGKTKISIDIIKKIKPNKILWVTPSTKLRDIDIPLEFKKWKALTFLRKTDIICYASMAKHKGKYDLIILDEYQDITEANVKPLFNKNITYKNILGLSGTHPKHKEKQDIYNSLGLKILLEIDIDEAVDKKLIAPYNITVIETKLNSVDKIIKAGNKKKPFYNTESAQYSYLTKLIAIKLSKGLIVPKFFYLNRMRLLYTLESKNKIAKKLISKLKGRTLIFTGGIKQAEEMCKYTFHSKTNDKDLNKFLSGKIDTLACVNSGGIGFTFENVDNFVIVQVNSNNKGDATQKIARSLVLQEGYTANIYILSVEGTVDEIWKNKVLKSFNEKRIKHIKWEQYE